MRINSSAGRRVIEYSNDSGNVHVVLDPAAGDIIYDWGTAGQLSITTTTHSFTTDSGTQSETLVNEIPAGTLILAASGIITTTVTGASGTLAAGYEGATTAFTSNFGALTKGTTFTAPLVPILVAAESDMVLTSGTGNFTAGQVEVTLWVLDVTAPTDTTL